jgi:hypothetical protein
VTPVVPFFRAWLWLAVAPPAVSAAGWHALFFVTNDCPISNQYAREIRRICEDYAEKGLRCELIYVNPRLSLEAARGHAAEFGHAGYTVSVDPRQQRARQSGVTVTPEVAVLDAAGALRYRGRIDDLYVSWGKPRRLVTDRTLRNAIDALLAGRSPAQTVTRPIGCYLPGTPAP